MPIYHRNVGESASQRRYFSCEAPISQPTERMVEQWALHSKHWHNRRFISSKLIKVHRKAPSTVNYDNCAKNWYLNGFRFESPMTSPTGAQNVELQKRKTHWSRGPWDRVLTCNWRWNELQCSFEWQSGCIRDGISTVSLDEFQDSEELDLEKTNIIALLREKSYKVHLCIRVTTNTLRPTVRVFDMGAGPNPVGTSFLLLNWHDYIRPIYGVSLKLASDSPVSARKVMLFVQLNNLQLCDFFEVVEEFAERVLFGTSFVKTLSKTCFQWNAKLFQCGLVQSLFSRNTGHYQNRRLY